MHTKEPPTPSRSKRGAGRAAATLAATALAALAIPLAGVGISEAQANSFGHGSAAWDAYYGAPGNPSTFAPFCAGGGGSVGPLVDGVPSCGPTGSTMIEIPGGISTPGFQCVELSERFMYVKKGWTTIGANGAQVAQRYAAKYGAPLVANGTAGRAPQVGDVLSFSSNAGFTDTGHTAVVSASNVDPSGNGKISIVSENVAASGSHQDTFSVSGWRVNNTVGGGYVEWLSLGLSAPRLAYQVVSQSLVGPAGQAVDLAHAYVGESGRLNITVKNTGTAAWDSNVRLATDQPQDRSASLLYNSGWIAANRLAAVAGSVAPGASYAFSVPVTIGGQNPSPTTAASFREAFTLVDEGVAWFPSADAVLSVNLTSTVDRGIVLRHHGSGGYVVAPDGAVTPFGGAPALAASATWPDWSIVRGIVLRSDDAGGYVLDGWGGLHPFGNAPALAGSAYWRGWDIARALVLRSDDLGGYVLDGWGGMHPFGDAPAVAVSGYWNGWDIARGAALISGTGGYVLDGWGGLHPFGDAPAVAVSGYWKGWDIARGVAAGAAGGGYVLDGWGAPHQFGGAPAASGFAYWSGTDTAKAITISRDATTGATVDETGAVHYFTP